MGGGSTHKLQSPVKRSSSRKLTGGGRKSAGPSIPAFTLSQFSKLDSIEVHVGTETIRIPMYGNKIPKLPKGWKNFTIVETGDGIFTGQITTDNPKDIKDWDKKGRVFLAKYTKQYLESLLGYNITKARVSK